MWAPPASTKETIAANAVFAHAFSQNQFSPLGSIGSNGSEYETVPMTALAPESATKTAALTIPKNLSSLEFGISSAK